MNFYAGTLTVDQSVRRQLVKFSECTSESNRISAVLYDVGLSLMDRRFSGEVARGVGTADWMTQELLRQRYGSWSVKRQDDCWEVVGYQSALIAEELSSSPVAAEDLIRFDRTQEQEDFIASRPWGKAFASGRIIENVSSAMGEINQAQKLLDASSLMLPPTPVERRLVLKRVRAMLCGLGYRKVDGPSSVGETFQKPGAHLSLRCRLTVLTGTLTTLYFYVLPLLDMSESSQSLKDGYDRGLHYEMLEAFVPNFGRYRSSVGELGLSMQLYAYQHMLEEVLPCLEHAARAAVAER